MTLPTALVIMVESVCRTREVPRNSGSVAFTFFPTEVFGAGIYSSAIIYGSVVLTTAVVRATPVLGPSALLARLCCSPVIFDAAISTVIRYLIAILRRRSAGRKTNAER